MATTPPQTAKQLLFAASISFTAWGLGLLCTDRAYGAEKPYDSRPNIIFLMADDQCSYSLGCYGNPDVKTPNIDQLAADGIIFDNHYVTTAICMASRATVMTGMYEHKTGCNFNHGPMHDETWQLSYPVLLRQAGYRTAFAGKFGFEIAEATKQEEDATPGQGRDRASARKKMTTRYPDDDFDVWGGSPGQTSFQTAKNRSMARYADEYPHSTLSYGAFGRDFILESARENRDGPDDAKSKKKTPFCLSISFKAPHRPVQPDPRFDKIYAGKTFTKPANFGRQLGRHLSPQSRLGRQYDRFVTWDYASDYDGVMAKYHQLCYAIDVAVGMIRTAVEEAGVADNTVIIYTSDNGYLCGSHGYGSKVLPYEESTRVPLILFDPRHRQEDSLPKQADRSGQSDSDGTAPAVAKPTRRTGALTGSIDFAPTILTLAGIAPPETMDGKSLLPIYADPETSIHPWIMLTNVWGPAATHSLAVVTRDWKYVYWFYQDAAAGMLPTEELFNTQHDPMELHNAIDDSAAGIQRDSLRTCYDQCVRHWRDHAVNRNNYARYGTIFDRHVDWEQKSKLIRSINQPMGMSADEARKLAPPADRKPERATENPQKLE